MTWGRERMVHLAQDTRHKSKAKKQPSFLRALLGIFRLGSEVRLWPQTPELPCRCPDEELHVGQETSEVSVEEERSPSEAGAHGRVEGS